MKKTILSSLLFAALLFLTACQNQPAAVGNPEPAKPKRPGLTVEAPAENVPAAEEDAADGDAAQPEADLPAEKCGLENCHGLEFSCGPDVPEVCTADYQLGDFCRQFAICEVADGQCQLMPDERLASCRTCVAACADLAGEPAFECEAECREQAK
ncbi:hypothetical protein COX69_00200 [Candidatus Falkowbacteria bacterium CG_4_10_14_0_2_um_filter_48_10]|uniref:Kazal-like domain-containing protein n=1 Tax=Candidatus Falkowbacteria bacterium CG23_combo_of_CG06-09_8_20_14_all_49_15 TaxID=1974572 RepID=A0A2G9ZLI7_9BACT|nr:MAG: hypothetical protein COX22_01260 [Candidatus Falkowbacteria bacterium CG23_combo_of_CG06-09_8_20_14_all_49_15]PJA09345.1 MAG: hypothetical protein COX69_00200 [Candidatus Falkowbacteria bacterium CG_4_10_14_0_2_um_filter_48_10]